MPVLDLGKVIGPPGQDGSRGPQGPQGNDGPNRITTATSTNLTGAIAGNGANVVVYGIDSIPGREHTNKLVSSAAVYDVTLAVGVGGIGKQLTSSDNLTNIYADGMYWWANTSVPTGAPVSYGFMLVISRAAEIIKQIVWSNDGIMLTRTIYAGSTTQFPWVYVVAPSGTNNLVLNNEYPTAEMCNGKIVYCQSKYLTSSGQSNGAIAANTTATTVFVDNTGENMPTILRAEVHGRYSTNLHVTAPYSDSNVTFTHQAFAYYATSRWQVRVTATATAAMTGCYATAWYTKE